jgi:Asp/Glu/hydantoin racemase
MLGTGRFIAKERAVVGMKIWYQSYMDAASGDAYWQKLRAHLVSLAEPDTEIVIHGITPHDSYAHPLVEWRCAREMICNAIKAEREGYDAFIVGHFQDAGLYEARSAVDIPVLGLGETSMLHACKLGQRIGLVTFKPSYIPWFRHQIARYGLRERIAAISTVRLEPSLYAAALKSKDDLQRLYQLFAEETRKLVADGVEVLIPTGGGPMVLLSGLKQVDGAPVLDGTAVGVKMAELAVKLRRLTGLGTSRVGEFAKAPAHIVEEFLAHPKGL